MPCVLLDQPRRFGELPVQIPLQFEPCRQSVKLRLHSFPAFLGAVFEHLIPGDQLTLRFSHCPLDLSLLLGGGVGVIGFPLKYKRSGVDLVQIFPAPCIGGIFIRHGMDVVPSAVVV